MVKATRKSPGVGRDTNSGDNLTDEAIEIALATEVLDQENMAAARERRKRNRKRAEGNGVPLAELDDLYKRRDDTVADVLAFFKLKFRVLSAHFKALKPRQADLFDMDVDHKGAIAHLGMMAGMKGEKALPPPTYQGEEIKVWMDAHEVGATRRSEAADAILESAQANPGKPVDATSGAVTKATAASVREQAAKDFEEDNAGSKPPDTTKDGVERIAGMPKMGELADGTALVGEDFVEASPEELAQQTSRPVEMVEAKDHLSGNTFTVRADDPMLHNGVIYKTQKALKIARGDIKPQQPKA